jgi:2-oxoglutarate dehydrogenase E1 component
MRDQPLKK